MALFSAIAGIFAGGAQKKASQKATDAQVAAINRGIDLQQQQYTQTRSDYAPYTAAGTAAIGGYSDLLGANGTAAQASAVSGLKSSPLYEQELADANENLLQTASATGGLRGGNTAGALAQLAPDLLEKHYNDALAGYGSLANLGLGATSSVAGFGANTAQNVSGLYGDIGTAQARNYLTKGGINAANFTNFGQVLDQAASAFLPAAFGGITAASTARTQGASRDLINANPSIF
jgi:hypothetical protein